MIKRKKAKEIDDDKDKEPKGPQDDDDKGKGDDKDKGKDKGKGKGKGNGTDDGSDDDDDDKKQGQDDQDDEEKTDPVDVIGNTFEEKVAFIAAKLTEINNELNEIEMQKATLDSQTSSFAADQLNILETRRKKLELIKSKYQIELMKLTGNTYERPDMGDQDLSAGGMSK